MGEALSRRPQVFSEQASHLDQADLQGKLPGSVSSQTLEKVGKGWAVLGGW